MLLSSEHITSSFLYILYINKQIKKSINHTPLRANANDLMGGGYLPPFGLVEAKFKYITEPPISQSLFFPIQSLKFTVFTGMYFH